MTRGLGQVGQSEVEDLYVSVVADHDVLGLYVPVDDVRLVGHGECTGDLNRHVDRVVERELVGHRGTEGAPLDEFHGQEADAVVFVQPVNRGDVGMVERREHLGLALETGQPFGILLEGDWKDLDRHLAVEGGVERLPYHAHATLTDFLDHAVVEQLLSGLDGHCSVLPQDGQVKRSFPLRCLPDTSGIG